MTNTYVTREPASTAGVELAPRDANVLLAASLRTILRSAHRWGFTRGKECTPNQQQQALHSRGVGRAASDWRMRGASKGHGEMAYHLLGPP